jgi:hypothetical protein
MIRFRIVSVIKKDKVILCFFGYLIFYSFFKIIVIFNRAIILAKNENSNKKY